MKLSDLLMSLYSSSSIMNFTGDLFRQDGQVEKRGKIWREGGLSEEGVAV